MSPLAVAIYDILRRRVPSKDPWISYGALCDLVFPAFGKIAPDSLFLSAALGEIVHTCRAHELPALSAIVVRADRPRVPGAGYYASAHPEAGNDSVIQLIAWAKELALVKVQTYPETLLARAHARPLPDVRAGEHEPTVAGVINLDADFRQHLSTRKSRSTVLTYTALARAFLTFVRTRHEGAPSRVDVEVFVAQPRADGGQRSASTRNQALAAIRALSAFAVREKLWLDDPTADMPFVKEARRDPAVLDRHEVRQLFLVAGEHADSPFLRARDLAILGLFTQMGLRVHELVALDVAQVDMASATMLAIHGKGGTTHDLPMNAPAISLLVAWLPVRAEITASGEPALFISRRGGRLTKRAVQHLLRRLRDLMGTKKKLSCHTLRHSCATLALTVGGADLSTVAELLRHSDLNTTRRYLHLVDTRRREAVRRLSVTVPDEVLPNAAVALGRVESAADAPANDVADRSINVTNPLVTEEGLDDAA